jgi:ADP-heptose:LPS heptosyltransferase
MPKKILLINLPGMGDTLMFTPVLPPLKAHFPQSHITALVMHASSRQILEENPYIDRVLEWNFMREPFFKTMNFIRRLRQERFDISLTSYPGNRAAYNITSFLIGARQRIAHQYRHHNGSNLHWLNHHTLTESNDRHNVEENIRLLEFLGIAPAGVARDPQFFLNSRNEQFALDFWQTHQLAKKELVVGMHTYSSEFKNMHRKCWPKERFAELIDLIAERYASAVVLFEGPVDEKNNDGIAALAKHQPIRVRQTSVAQTAALLKKCQVVVSNDSGVMHLAAAVKTPCVAIFGPTNPQKLGPFYAEHVVVRKGLPCSPCFYYSADPLTCRAGLDYGCLCTITAAEVLEAIAKLNRRPKV